MADVKRLQIRRDTLADWVSVNPILLEGEVGLIIENGGISSLKIGDGASSFMQLPQLTLLEAVFGGYVSRQDLSASLRDYATTQYVDSELSKILGGASGAYDTLKEIEDILKNDTTGLAALLEEIGTKADTGVVDALASRVSQNESNIADHANKITANTDNIDSTIRRVAANEADLKQLNITVDTINREYVKKSDIPTKTSQLIDDIGYALSENIKALAGLDIVTKDYIADAAVTTSKVKDGAITSDKLSSAIRQQLGWIPSNTDDLPEGSNNLYFTNSRAMAAVSPRLEKVEDGLTATQEEVRGYSVLISELQGSIALKANESDLLDVVEALEALDEGITATLEGYAKKDVATITSDGLMSASDKVNLEKLMVFYEGTELEGVIDTWAELEKFLDGFDTTKDLAELLKGKADKSTVDALASRVAANEDDLKQLNITVDTIYGEYVKKSEIPTKTSQLIDDIGYALARNIKALAGLDIVTKDYIADAAVTTSKIKDGAITSDKLSTAIQQQLSWIPSTTDDLPEGSSNLYFTNARAVAAVDGASLSSLKVGGYGVSENIKALIQSATAVSGDISKINVRIEGLDGDIKRIDGYCDEFNASIGNLESSVRTNTTDIAGIVTRLDNVDTVPTLNSSNLVTSGGVAKAVADLAESADGLYQRKGSYLTSSSTLASAKLDKNTITIASTSVSLGGSITQNQLIANLGLKGLAFKDSIEITSSNVTGALGYTPYNSANFTKANIKSTLGISDWALASSKPTYTAAEVGALPSTTVIPNASDFLKTEGGAITGSLLVGGAFILEDSFYIGSDASNYASIDSDGNGVFNSLKVGGSDVIHSGNIGSQSVANASKLGGIDAGSFFCAKGTGLINNEDANTYWANGAYLNQTGNGSNNTNFPQKYCIFVNFTSGQNQYVSQLSLGTNQAYYRTKIDSWGAWIEFITSNNISSYAPIINSHISFSVEEGVNSLGYSYSSESGLPLAGPTIAFGHDKYRAYLYGRNGALHFNSMENTTLTGWKTIAFTDSTVAAAQKLSTKRNIWGQSFDGSGDVNGTIENTYGILPAADSLYDIGTSNKQYRYVYAAWIGAKTGGDFSLGANNAYHMYINSSGNVGIGTNNPNTKLHVVGGAKIEGALSTYGITATTTAATDAAFTHYVGSAKLWWVSSYNNCANFHTALYVQSGSSPIKVATVNDLSSYLPKAGGTISGSLTFSATSGSHIVGNSNSEIIFQPSNDTSRANIPLKIAKTGSSTYTMYCDESEVYDLGTSSYKWNILYCRSASQSSDATLKNILSNVELTTSQIANAPAVNFTWKNGGTKDVGTIAQYWKNVLPEVVSGEEGSYGMNYAVLGVVSSIILARNIETHEQRIARLEKEISDLQKELNALVNNE